jgi:hypothetical protein
VLIQASVKDVSLNEFNLEDTQRTRRRLRTQKIQGNEPYAGGTVPVKTLAGKARMRKVEELVRAKKFADDMRLQEQHLARSANAPQPPKRHWLPRAVTAVFAALAGAFKK